MNLAIVGYGKMGRLIERLAPEYGFDVKLRLNRENNGRFEGLTPKNVDGIDVAVEFSNAEAAAENIERLARAGVNAVVGTTGWLERLPRVRETVERAGTGVVWAPNFSVGIFVFTQIVSQAAQLLANEADYGSWAWEIHHATKRDAPSGTLLALAARMKESGYQRRPIDLSSSRAGSHPGTHEIGFESPADTITLRHSARSRDGFARGALRAACWIAGKKGFFEFREIIGQMD
ncbi:MAG TPA: dihydrodipicolinate reductase C-terminal domain-containing protein [Candidatus Acidoferrales bacterium]